MAAFFLINTPQIIETAGYIGLFTAVFLESGIFFGFFLPGDSLLFSAGFLASTGHLNIWLLLFTVIAAAILGDSAGYWFGAKLGSYIYTHKENFFFRRKHIERTRVFFEKYGPRAIVFARFVPIVRTFAPILAGVGEMNYRTFLSYNVVGGIIWGVGMTTLGYILGAKIPQTNHYLPLITVGIVIISVTPIAWEWWKSRKMSAAE